MTIGTVDILVRHAHDRALVPGAGHQAKPRIHVIDEHAQDIGPPFGPNPLIEMPGSGQGFGIVVRHAQDVALVLRADAGLARRQRARVGALAHIEALHAPPLVLVRPVLQDARRLQGLG